MSKAGVYCLAGVAGAQAPLLIVHRQLADADAADVWTAQLAAHRWYGPRPPALNRTVSGQTGAPLAEHDAVV